MASILNSEILHHFRDSEIVGTRSNLVRLLRDAEQGDGLDSDYSMALEEALDYRFAGVTAQTVRGKAEQSFGKRCYNLHSDILT